MDVTRYTLDNGMHVILQPRQTAPVVACEVWVNVGSADEEPREAGLAHVHEHMLFKGTEKRGVGEIAREVEAAGGHINAFTSFDQTCYYVVMSSRFFEKGVDILSDAIRNSAFDAEELSNELEVIQEEIKRGKDSPERVASQMLFDTAFRTHPYRLPVIGTKESVDSFRREDVLNFFKKHYRPDNITVVLVGEFELDEAQDLVSKYFADWASDSYARHERDNEPDQRAFRGNVDSRPIQENHLRLAFHIPDIVHPDIPALDVLGAIMGFGDSAHLYQTIQREKELVNAVYSVAYSPMNAGIYLVGADYQLEGDKSHTGTAQALLTEVFRFREMKVADADLDRARLQLESQEIYAKQSAEGIATKLGRSWATTGDTEFEEKYYRALAEVTPEDVRRVAREYLSVDNLTAVLLRSESTDDVSVADLQGAAERAYADIQVDAIDTGIQADSRGFAKIDLPHGPSLLIQEDHSVETFSMRAMTMGGVRYETPETNGLNSLLSSVLTRGTDSRSAVDIAREVESMAGGISGMSGRNSFGLTMGGLSRFFDRNFEIFADILLNAAVPEDEFERERKLQLQSIASRQDRLNAVNYDRFSKAFFGDYPYGLPSGGTEESVGNLKVETAREYLKKLLRTEGMVLTVVGDVDAAEVARLAERYFAAEASSAWRPKIPAPLARTERIVTVGNLEKEQAFVTVGFDAPLMGDERRYALEVLYAILSGQGGRLFYELRDKQSLAYSVYASMVMGLDASAFTINIGTSPEKIDQAVNGMFGEVQKLRDHGVTEDEVKRACTYLIGNHDIGLQKNSSRAMSFALDELYGFGFERTLEYSDKIAAVDAAAIQDVVNEFLVAETSVIAITKPEAMDIASFDLP